jgi:hypothetical protein
MLLLELALDSGSSKNVLITFLRFLGRKNRLHSG